jgi:hypothetical protein
MLPYFNQWELQLSYRHIKNERFYKRIDVGSDI